MEPLWSPVVATGGNQRQMRCAHDWRKQAKSVATGCHRLPETFHGKEGVDHGPVEVRLARNWRTPLDLRQLSAKSRLPEPALTGAIKDQRRTPAQLVFDFCGCYELQATSQTHRSSGPMCLSKKSRLQPSACAASVGVSARRSWRGT
jgi:hypothetical protein